jgi:hypothetical protein
VFWISQLLIVIQMYAYNSMAVGGRLFVSFAVSFKPEDTYWWQACTSATSKWGAMTLRSIFLFLFKCKNKIKFVDRWIAK